MKSIITWLCQGRKQLLWIVIYSCCFLFSISGLFSITNETASLRDFIYGATEYTAYDNWVSHVVEGLARPGFNWYAPWDVQTNGFGDFVNSNSEQRAIWQSIVNLFIQGELSQAQNAIENSGFPYHIVQFYDTDTGRTYYMLREDLNMEYYDDNGEPFQPEIHQHGSFDYGWGIYIFNPSSDVPAIINVVHPKDDFIAPPIAVQAFQLWDARYLMIAGAGREVLWSGSYYHSNAVSLSDPSRNVNHVFNVSYQAFADEIRTTFNRREFSAQIHSFDYRHMGYKSLQISATYDYPQLPIRDLSGNYLDIVNASPYVVIPANTIGIHDDILVTDYYSVYYDLHGMYYRHGDELLPVSNNINLPGVGGFPKNYTMANRNFYDVYTPFFHIEMEELPSAYPQNSDYYKWFYGFNTGTGRWNPEEHYTKAIAYYTPWLEAMAQVLPLVLNLDDNQLPTNPTDLTVSSTGNTNVQLTWQKSNSYDFETYEILFAPQPINLEPPNYNIRDRNNTSLLASQAVEQIAIGGLLNQTQYYFVIRTKDYQGNYSLLSNQVTRYTGMVSIDNFKALGRDDIIELSWLARFQIDNQGFNLYRKEEGQHEYQLIASWETDPWLVGSEEDNVTYQFPDIQLQNNVLYHYKIATVDIDQNEYYYQHGAPAAAREIYTLTVQNAIGTIYDTVEFGSNLFATDGYDINYDIVKGSSPDQDYIWAMSYKSSWPTSVRNLQRDIYGFYEPDQSLRSWIIRVRTDQLYQPLYISISDNYSRNSEKLFLYDQTMNLYTDLTVTPLIFEAYNYTFRDFTLYWGNLLPSIQIQQLTNSFLQADEQVTFSWSIDRDFLIDTINIYLKSESDSLLIANNLSGNTTFINWTVPDFVTINNARIVVCAVLADGGRIEYSSSYRIGILPSITVFDHDAGWHLVSNPLETPTFFDTEVFGHGSGLFIYDSIENQYEQVREFDFGVGHWVYLPNDYYIEIIGNIRKYPYEMELQQGWNLVPAVFMLDMGIKDFLFDWGDNQFSFKDALRFNLINRSVIGVENNGYRYSDRLLQGSSIWLYANHDDITLELIPFRNVNDNINLNVDWEAFISVSQPGFIRDEVIIGSAPLTNENYNYYYDLPKPPERPDSKIYFTLIDPFNNYPFGGLHAKYKSDLNRNSPDVRVWNYKLMIDKDFQPITFSLNSDNLPEFYKVLLSIEEQWINLSETGNYLHQPSSNVIFGQVKVTNINNYNDIEEIPELPVLYSNYPNPFFVGSGNRRITGTNIPYYLYQESRVIIDVFNIRGQRVITLIDERREAGRHVLYWDGKDNRNRTVASGVYFYRLSVEGKTISVKKMMLLK